MVFLQIIELIDNSTCQNGKNRTENNTVNFKVKYKISERFILIEQEKVETYRANVSKAATKKRAPSRKPTNCENL
jgi:hypothetical protein